MQIKRKPKKYIIIAIAALVIIAGCIAYFAVAAMNKHTRSDGTSVNYDPPTSDQLAAGNQIKENSVNPDNASKPNVSGSDQPASPVPQSNGKSKVSATLTAANQNGSTLQIRSDIGTVTNSGTCTLTMTKGSSTVTKSAAVQALAGGTTCTGFDIPVSELSAGTWKIALHFENNDLVADTTRDVVVQ